MGVNLTESNYLFRVDFIKSYAQNEHCIISPIQLRSQLISLSLYDENNAQQYSDWSLSQLRVS